MTDRVEFAVPGKPAPQGSKRHVGGGRLIESSKAVGPWRERIAMAAAAAMGGRPPWAGCEISVALDFAMPRPASLPRSRPTPPAIKRPDADKLARACLDAMTHIVFADDSQVTSLIAYKRIAEPDEQPGVDIKVLAWDQDRSKRPLDQTLGRETSTEG
jgi:crossover junction endodeoxyribonuclease RusA